MPIGKRKRAKEFRRALDVARQNGGQTGDGGFALFDGEGSLLQYSPPAVTDGVRRLVARLEASDGGSIPTVIAMTSTLSGEGVTFVSRSLGAVLAHDLGRSVVIVELNWTKPRRDRGPSAALGQVGLAQVLDGSVRLEDALQATVVDGLAILPAGEATVSQRPILARSEMLGTTIATLRTRFRHIVLDLPAIFVSSEVLTLASYADAVGLVVRQGITPEPQITRALAELDHLTVLGVVLNQWSSRVPNRILAALSPSADVGTSG